MGRREFYAWVEQCVREGRQANHPGSWDAASADPWWQEKWRERKQSG